jgi:hypothetical protein
VVGLLKIIRPHSLATSISPPFGHIACAALYAASSRRAASSCIPGRTRE